MRHFLILLIVTASAALSGCAGYSARSITATVVDAASGEPIPGANVVATWELRWMPLTLTESGGKALLAQSEGVTDAQGRFHIPAWGPKGYPPNAPGRAGMDPMQPRIMIFKSGYQLRYVSNAFAPGFLEDPFYRGASERSSDWDGKSIPLSPLPKVMTDQDWQSLFYFTYDNVMVFDCHWKTMSLFLASIIKEGERIKMIAPRANIRPLPTLRQIDESWGGPGRCGRAADLIDLSK